MALGTKYIEKFASYLSNEIANLSNKKDGLITSSDPDEKIILNQAVIFTKFREMVRKLIEPFTNEVEIDVNDILGFVEIMLSDYPDVDIHIQALKRFKGEIELLWGLILRYSTINRFLKEWDSELKFDPETFITRFKEYLKKRLGGFNLVWQEYIFNWLDQFRTINQPLFVNEEKKEQWSVQKIIEIFIKFINSKVEEELSLDGFKKPMKQYLDKFATVVQFKNVLEIGKTYEMSLEIIVQFPDFIRQTFTKKNESLDDKPFLQPAQLYIGPIPSIEKALETKKEVAPQDSLLAQKMEQLEMEDQIAMAGQGAQVDKLKFSPDGIQMAKLSSPMLGKEGYFERLPFYDFILETRMKYFSRLIAKPTELTLKYVDKASFQGKQLFHNIEFKYWDKFLKMYLSSNFLDVVPMFK
jgi:hypothetical protein